MLLGHVCFRAESGPRDETSEGPPSANCRHFELRLVRMRQNLGDYAQDLAGSSRGLPCCRNASISPGLSVKR